MGFPGGRSGLVGRGRPWAPCGARHCGFWWRGGCVCADARTLRSTGTVPSLSTVHPAAPCLRFVGQAGAQDMVWVGWLLVAAWAGGQARKAHCTAASQHVCALPAGWVSLLAAGGRPSAVAAHACCGGKVCGRLCMMDNDGLLEGLLLDRGVGVRGRGRGGWGVAACLATAGRRTSLLPDGPWCVRVCVAVLMTGQRCCAASV